ncbi:MFS transporter, YNFM family, putative membrane transport protein [Pelosinus fermentans]|uniref:Major facilitator superfamily MFS_1 n=2 Tax=Sporomusaceae TaxID=1843490 RepID=I8RD20_9FIRM|nr:major facilitator superfamily MFS_1 [Pelosinus fermentans B4]OAM93845.1 major facilitator superfamily MFS_1 [Pelosinus fermentans DSM 17108]SDQ92065.1 MFS transporter, YNFM family, putative membrane transport protein [Pelosinus fermentans]
MRSMKTYIQKNSTAYWRGISAMFLGSFVTFALLYCMQPLIPVFSEEFHIAPAYASLSISLTTGIMAFFMLLVSWFSDAKGRKIVMAISLSVSAILGIIIAFCNNFSILLILRILQGIMLAGFPAIAMAYVNEEFDPKIVGMVMGIYISGNSVGGLAGRIMVSTLADFSTWHIAVAGISTIGLLLSIWFWIALPKSQNFSPKKRDLREMLAALTKKLQNIELLMLYSISFLIMGGFVTLYNYIGYSLMAPPYNLSQTLVGCIFIVYLIGTFSSTFMGKLADSNGSSKVLCLSIGIMLLGCLTTVHGSLSIKIVGVALFTFGFFGSHSVASSWVGKCAHSDKAQAASLYLLFFYLGASTIGTIGGKFLLWYDWEGVVIVIALALVLALILSGVLLLREMRYKIYSAAQS